MTTIAQIEGIDPSNEAFGGEAKPVHPSDREEEIEILEWEDIVTGDVFGSDVEQTATVRLGSVQNGGE